MFNLPLDSLRMAVQGCPNIVQEGPIQENQMEHLREEVPVATARIIVLARIKASLVSL